MSVVLVELKYITSHINITFDKVLSIKRLPTWIWLILGTIIIIASLIPIVLITSSSVWLSSTGWIMCTILILIISPITRITRILIWRITISTILIVSILKITISSRRRISTILWTIIIISIKNKMICKENIFYKESPVCARIAYQVRTFLWVSFF